jgi:hypothetical protein
LVSLSWTIAQPVSEARPTNGCRPGKPTRFTMRVVCSGASCARGLTSSHSSTVNESMSGPCIDDSCGTRSTSPCDALKIKAKFPGYTACASSGARKRSIERSRFATIMKNASSPSRRGSELPAAPCLEKSLW